MNLKSNKVQELTSQCFQVVLAERCHLLKDTSDSAIQESFQATYGDINSNQGLPEVLSFIGARLYLANMQREESPDSSMTLRKF